jgi:hypothetical protein
MKRLADTPKEDLKKVATDIAGELVCQMKGLCQGAT